MVVNWICWSERAHEATVTEQEKRKRQRKWGAANDRAQVMSVTTQNETKKCILAPRALEKQRCRRRAARGTYFGRLERVVRGEVDVQKVDASRVRRVGLHTRNRARGVAKTTMTSGRPNTRGTDGCSVSSQHSTQRTQNGIRKYLYIEKGPWTKPS